MLFDYFCTLCRLDVRERLGHEVTSQTQAVQSTAAQMQARDWLGHEVTSQTQAKLYRVLLPKCRPVIGWDTK
jgi:hypothetical protein